MRHVLIAGLVPLLLDLSLDLCDVFLVLLQELEDELPLPGLEDGRDCRVLGLNPPGNPLSEVLFRDVAGLVSIGDEDLLGVLWVPGEGDAQGPEEA